MYVNEFGRMWRGFMPARVILTANEIKVFDHLRRPATFKQLAQRAGITERGAEILLDALVSLGLLTKKDGRYANTAVAEKFLVAGAPEYQGNIMRHTSTMWENWGGLSEVLRTGKPARRAFDHEGFILGMDDVTRPRLREMVSKMSLRGVKRALDLGGGPGTAAIAMAKRGISVTLFDRPETIAIARRMARRDGVRLKYMGGDFMTGPLGRGYDYIFVSQILHAYSIEDSVALLAKCHGALEPGGRLVVHEFVAAPDRTSPPAAALFAINMLVGTEAGRTYTDAEIRDMMARAGFARISRKDLAETVMFFGAKPGKKR